MSLRDEMSALLGESRPRANEAHDRDHETFHDHDHGRPGYDKHDALAEEMTTAIEQDLDRLTVVVNDLAPKAKRLSKVDGTHGMRVYEAVRDLRAALVALNAHTEEMRRHLDEDTP